MSLSKEQKTKVIAQVAEVANEAYSVIAADYNGLTAEEMTGLRSKARAEKVHLQVVKNTLVKKAFEGTEFECMQDKLVGPLIYAFSQEDPGGAARVMQDFIKENDTLEVKVISIGGEVLGNEDLMRLSKLPNKEQAISMLMSVMKAPVEKLVRTLAEPHGKLVRTFAALKDVK